MDSQRYSSALQRGGSYSGSNGSSAGSHGQIRDVVTRAFNFPVANARRRFPNVVDQKHEQARSAKTLEGETKLIAGEDCVPEQPEAMRNVDRSGTWQLKQDQSQNDAVPEQD